VVQRGKKLSSISCPSCNKLNFSDSKACYSCGASLRGGPPGPPPNGFQQQSASFRRDWSDASQIERTSFVDAINSTEHHDGLWRVPPQQRLTISLILFVALALFYVILSNKAVDNVGANMADKWGITFE
jgi:hypothetical protein